MKILIDTNVFISYLLARGSCNDIVDAVEKCMTDTYLELVVPQEVIEEMERVVVEKEYLRTRILNESLVELVNALKALGTIRPPLQEVTPISRDPSDDFLLAHGRQEDVNLLVTGDEDLLSLSEPGSFRIISPAALWALLFGGGNG